MSGRLCNKTRTFCPQRFTVCGHEANDDGLGFYLVQARTNCRPRGHVLPVYPFNEVISRNIKSSFISAI